MLVFKKTNNKILQMERLHQRLYDAPEGEYVIKKYKRTRTTDQNKYYWWLLDIVSKETWTDKDELHERMRMKFLKVEEDGKLPYCKSTASLDVWQFIEYIENVKNFFAEFGIVLPSAEEFEKYLSDK